MGSMKGIKGFGRGADHPMWKGGRAQSGNGYWDIWVTEDNMFYPMARSKHKHSGGGYVREHRLEMAKYLGRCLLPTEVVHHRNGVRTDNRIENLCLQESKKGHKNLHPNVVCPHCGKHFILTEGTPLVNFI